MRIQVWFGLTSMMTGQPHQAVSKYIGSDARGATHQCRSSCALQTTIDLLLQPHVRHAVAVGPTSKCSAEGAAHREWANSMRSRHVRYSCYPCPMEKRRLSELLANAREGKQMFLMQCPSRNRSSRPSQLKRCGWAKSRCAKTMELSAGPGITDARGPPGRGPVPCQHVPFRLGAF